MAQTPQQDNQPGRLLAFADWLKEHRRFLAYGQLIAGLGLLAIPIVLGVQQGFMTLVREWNVIFFWGFLAGAIMLLFGILNLPGVGGSDLDTSETFRLMLLGWGGCVGLVTFLLGFLLPALTYRELFFQKGPTEWRNHPWLLVGIGAAMIGGQVIMLVSLMLGQGMERENAPLRRLMYGYKAVQDCLLLLGILILFNVLANKFTVGPFGFFNKTYSWEASGFYTLSDLSKQTLTNLDERVEVKIILPERLQVTDDVNALLVSARGYTDKIEWAYISRDRDRGALELLREKYSIPESLGLLVIYGEEPKTDSSFIKLDDLYKRDPGPTGRPGADNAPVYQFYGERELMKTIRFLAKGKKKTVVYFTQGNGELELNKGLDPRDGESLGMLANNLRESNFNVKDLQWEPGTQTVPEDADVIVVARPTRELPADMVQALRDYMKGSKGKKGKLLVLTDVQLTRAGGGREMVKTGLADYLQEYGVDLGQNRVLSTAVGQGGVPIPTLVPAEFKTPTSNTLALGFIKGNRSESFLFHNVRTVSPLPGSPGTYQAAELMVDMPGARAWVETNLTAHPLELWQFMTERTNQREARKKLESRGTHPLAVTVSERGQSRLPQDQVHASLRDDTPRMVVFGAASWASNRWLTRADLNDDLFRSSLAWLTGEVSAVGSEPPKERQPYQLKPDQVTSGSVRRLLFLPLGLMLLVVIGLGCGVWVVRRR